LRGSRDQSSRGSGAGSEITQPQLFSLGMMPNPIRGQEEPFSQKTDIESQLTRLLIQDLFIFCQKIEQKRRETALIQVSCHALITGTHAATAAAMGKENNATRLSGTLQKSMQNNPSALHPHRFKPVLIHGKPPTLTDLHYITQLRCQGSEIALDQIRADFHAKEMGLDKWDFSHL
jgi:hypothetical protein